MSGAGRKSGYRKSVTDSYANDLPVPCNNEVIGRVKGCIGGNMFDIEFPLASPHKSSSSVVLPSKFRKVIWVKRGDYVIVDIGNNDNNNDKDKNNDNTNNNDNNNEDDSDKYRYAIKHILNKDQIKHIKSLNLWPEEFDNDDGKRKEGQGYGNDDDIMPGYQEEEYYDDDDIVNDHVDTNENI
jgi:probable RNA-binding protein EIF1AD